MVDSSVGQEFNVNKNHYVKHIYRIYYVWYLVYYIITKKGRLVSHCRLSLMVIKAFDDEVIMLPLLLSSDF